MPPRCGEDWRSVKRGMDVAASRARKKHSKYSKRSHLFVCNCIIFMQSFAVFSPGYLLVLFGWPFFELFFSSPQDFGVAEANVLVWVNQGSRFLVILFIFSECRSAVCDLVWVICLASHFSGPKIKTHIFRNGTVWSRCLLCFANV